MKLCHIVPSLEERHGGPSKSSRELCAALARQGAAVTLSATAPHGGSVDTTGSLTIQTFPRSIPQSFCSSTGLRHALRRTDADIVHHHALWLRTLAYASGTARRLSVPLVISPRGMMNAWAWRHHRWKKWLADQVIHPGALRAAAGWHATSEEEAEDIRRLGFSQPICVAPNGIALPTAEALESARQFWLKLCPATASRPTAVFYSRFHRKKRVLELIDVWLEQAPADWLLLIVGIPEEYSVQQLEEYVTHNPGQGQVRIFDGLGRPPPYAIASLFVLPTHSENFGLSIAEALAAGVPVLVTDGAPWQRVNAAGAGWCVPWAQFGETLRAATAEGLSRLKSRGQTGRDWVAQAYSWDPPARLLLDFYTQLRSHAA